MTAQLVIVLTVASVCVCVCVLSVCVCACNIKSTFASPDKQCASVELNRLTSMAIGAAGTVGRSDPGEHVLRAWETQGSLLGYGFLEGTALVYFLFSPRS